MPIDSAAVEPTPARTHPAIRGPGHVIRLRSGRSGTRPQPPAGPLRAEWTRAQFGRRDLATWAISAALHLVLGLVLWNIILDGSSTEPIDTMIRLREAQVENPPDLQAIEQPQQIRDDAASLPRDMPARVVAEALAPANMRFPDPELAVRPEIDDALGPMVPNLADHFSGRSSASRRQALVDQLGGNAASEQAVLWGLEWLTRHQSADGSWSFDHVHDDDCRRECTMPGELTDCRMGATAMALLCFLGAGHTPESGEFRRQVQAGVNFVIDNMQISQFGGDLRDGDLRHGMYVQGLAAIALCEAYAMTSEVVNDQAAAGLEEHDPAEFHERQRNTSRLREAAQQAIGFIAWAQAEDGGWRYMPQQDGDTSVVGWQVMALQSARAARIRVPSPTLAGATRFLNKVQIQRGARYGYTSRGHEGSATTAVGLLCRMYLGWRRDFPGLSRGVRVLSQRGPSRDDMYYNYYATQVLHHWGGEDWTRWNTVMRDRLIDTQQTEGHAKGSWRPTSAHGSSHGGRLYQTTLSIMTLEVYYRHLPLYRERHFEGDLPAIEAE